MPTAAPAWWACSSGHQQLQLVKRFKQRLLLQRWRSGLLLAQLRQKQAEPAHLQQNLALVSRARSIASLDAPAASGDGCSTLLELLHAPDAELPLEVVALEHRAEQVRAALDLLPEQQRQVVISVVMQGASQRVVSREMGLSYDRVGTLLRQGQRRLALLLQELREEQSAPPAPAQHSLLEALDELQLLVAA